MKPIRPITGLIAAPFTPMQASGQLNLPLVARYAEHLIRDGVAGAFICGTTGEGASLTESERRQVVEAWCGPKPALQIIVHVGHNANAEACALAQHAQAVGAHAIATVSPGFFRPANIDELIAWCEPVAASAPELPFYFYHMPSMAGADFPMAEFLPVAVKRIPTFAGIKYTHGNLVDYGDTLRAAAGRVAVLAGRDELLLPFLSLGATGAVGSTYNYAAPVFQRLIAAYARNDRQTAQDLQGFARDFIGVVNRFGGVGANKVTMGLATGIDCGPPRSPLRRLGDAEISRLRGELESIGFFRQLAGN